ncbi:MAG: phosphopantothenoylcysteine decarboxylase, partial [Anaeroplasma sp.]|nr:phosphopantothenoylcysteine decarboxylase [Anaeroplasma sp.]
YQAVTSRAEMMDIIIKAAAVADYTPKEVATEKTKKKDGDMSIPLVRTKDILKELGQNRKEGQVLCGFSMETENMEENSRKKLLSKNLDLIVANNLKDAGAGFQTDTNKITIFSGEGKKEYPLMTKDEVADVILDVCRERLLEK